MISHGAEEINRDEAIYMRHRLKIFGRMQKHWKTRSCTILHAELTREPTTTMQLNDEQEAEFNALLELIEDDDDVTNVFTTLA